MNRTSIEYLTHSWNPLAMRCTPVSAGCKNCWHLGMADRLAENPKIPLELRWAYAGNADPLLVESRLEEPIRARKPGRIGVQFMGDLFHEDIPFEVITQIFDVMADARCQEHTFVVLTKRPERYDRWLNWVCEYWPGDTPFGMTMEVCGHISNIWFGVSVENQETADERIPELLRIPAAVWFVSVEPMLEEIDLCNIVLQYSEDGNYDMLDALNNNVWFKYTCLQNPHQQTGLGLNWVIVGAESGPHARPMDENWVRDLRDQCIDTNVPFFYKQRIENGKKILIPQLDGQVWNQYPKGAT